MWALSIPNACGIVKAFAAPAAAGYIIKIVLSASV